MTPAGPYLLYPLYRQQGASQQQQSRQNANLSQETRRRSTDAPSRLSAMTETRQITQARPPARPYPRPQRQMLRIHPEVLRASSRNILHLPSLSRRQELPLQLPWHLKEPNHHPPPNFLLIQLSLYPTKERRQLLHLHLCLEVQRSNALKPRYMRTTQTMMRGAMAAQRRFARSVEGSGSLIQLFLRSRAHSVLMHL